MVINKNVTRKKRLGKTCPINIRVKESVKKWMDKNNVSPTKLFNEALKDIKCPCVGE